MMNKPFSGRIVFDHLPKTAGQAVVTWLTDALGDGVVMPFAMWMSHKNCIANYGGLYSIVSGHLAFNGESLDPRYNYVTLFREPVSRCISALSYHVNNFSPTDLPVGLWQASYDFLVNEGDIDDLSLEKLDIFLNNGYINHFSRINTDIVLSGDAALNHTFDVIKENYLFGFFEDFPSFLEDFSGLLGAELELTLPLVNATRQTSNFSWEITEKLIDRLKVLNNLDLALYKKLCDIYALKRKDFSCLKKSVVSYVKYPLPQESDFVTDELISYHVNLPAVDIFRVNDLINVYVDFNFKTKINSLKFSIEIRGSLGIIVFQALSDNFEYKINSEFSALSECVLRIGFVPELPDGFYTLSLVVFSDVGLVLKKCNVFKFQLITDRPPYFEGSSYIPVSAELSWKNHE